MPHTLRTLFIPGAKKIARPSLCVTGNRKMLVIQKNCRVGALHCFLLAGIIVLMGVAPASASWGNRLRASRPDLQQQAEAEAGRDWARSMLSTRDPSCTMPTADPCTLNTTAIGMVEAGYAVYYDG